MRSYGQYCGLARALEIVGDRWTLLIVRQLLIAPARYRDLIEGLPGIATNLLADRLRHLEKAGVVERRVAGGANAVEYALTPWGAELRGPVESLMRWSIPLMIPGPQGDAFRPEWLTLAVPALLAPRLKIGVSATIALDTGGPLLHLRATPTGVDVGPSDGSRPDATLRADPTCVLGLCAGVITPSGAQDLGLLAIDGDASVVQAVFGA